MTFRLTLAEAVTKLLAKPVPVLFFDACALLDLVRFGRADRSIHLSVVEDAQRLVHASDRGAVSLMGLELLKVEIDDHLAAEQQRSFKEFERLGDQLERALGGLDLRIGPGNVKAWQALKPQFLRLPAEMRSLSDALMARVALLRDDPECNERARIRAVLKFPPSHKKESRKDCEVFEHALALSRALKERGYKPRRVLVTANTTDFDRDKLGLELTDAGLMLAPSLSNAFGRAGRP